MSGGCQSSRGHYIRGRLAKTTTRLLLLRAKGTSLPIQTADGPGNRAHVAPRSTLTATSQSHAKGAAKQDSSILTR